MTPVVHRMKNTETLDEFLKGRNVKDFERVAVAGGDGTINNVASAMIKHGIDIPVGILPTGVTNDFAKHFDLPENLSAAVNIIEQGDFTASDIAYINGSIFLNAVFIGIKEFQNLNSFNVEIKSQDFTFEGEVFLILAMNGKSAGGFKRVMKDADFSDGLLDILVIKKCPLFELGRIMVSLGSGRYKESAYSSRFKSKYLKITSGQGVSSRADGEEGPDLPIEISVSNKKLKVLAVPGGGTGNVGGVFSFNEIMGAAGGIIEIIKDMPRHNVLEYVNKDTISKAFYDDAGASIGDGYIYIVLSSTGTAASELIRSVTKKDYSHVSLSFDADLKTLLSYNGGNNLFAPGMSHELLKFFYKKNDANLLVYKLKATKEQKQAALDEVRKIDAEGSSYNLIGLLLPYSHKENIMFCSQFVYGILKKTGLDYFEKEPYDVKPMDFVELDLRRNLEFHCQLYLKDIIDENK